MRLAATDPHKHQLAPANTGAERLFGTSFCFHDKKKLPPADGKPAITLKGR